MARKQGRVKPPKSDSAKDAVFLNVPYDESFVTLFLAYIAGVSAFGLVPRATLEIPGSTRRLDRIISLIETCRYSIHDMSYVKLDRNAPRTPRFNMPFELGLAVCHEKTHGQHTWFVFETVKWRLQKSLSDLNGTDIYIHDGRIHGVFRELAQAFVRSQRQPTVQQMRTIYDKTRNMLPNLLAEAGASGPFQARVFRDISVYASALADEITA